MLKNKKAEMGETITWVVATVIILVILTIFIFASSLLAKAKSISLESFNLDSGKVDIDSISYAKIETEFALRENSDNSNKITEWINKLEEETNE